MIGPGEAAKPPQYRASDRCPSVLEWSVMATPKKRASKARSRRRRAINMALRAPQLVECNNCGNRILPHRVCPKCGFYRGKQVLMLEEMA